MDRIIRAAQIDHGHAAVAGGGRGAGFRSPATQGFLGRAGQRTEAHPSDRHRNVQVDRLLGEPGAKPDIGRAFLAVAFQRIARDRRAEKQQVVEMRHLALRAAADRAVPLQADNVENRLPTFSTAGWHWYNYHLTTFDAAALGVISKAAAEAWKFTGLAVGTAGWFRFYPAAGNPANTSATEARIDGSVAASGGDLNLTNISITIGSPNTIDVFQFTMPAE